MALHVASPSTTIAVRIAVWMLAFRESSSGPRGHRVSAVRAMDEPLVRRNRYGPGKPIIRLPSGEA
jgi:hypothetical protein